MTGQSRSKRPGEDLSALAKKSRLGYALVKKSSSEEEELRRVQEPAQQTYQPRPMMGATHEELTEFFNSRPRRDHMDPFGDSSDVDDDPKETHLPGGFWTLEPKEAARRLVNENRVEASISALRKPPLGK